MKRVYRFALMHFIGIVGSLMTMLSAWSLYFTANKDFVVPMLFGILATWFYIEVVSPKKK